MPRWRLAKSLEQLRATINEEFPGRSRVSDGSIGDSAHASRKSDHNPNEDGVVTAIDITHDPKSGCTGNRLAEAFVSNQDPRIKYIIWDKRIIKSYKDTAGIAPWTWQRYTGSNNHSKHIHISVWGNKEKYDDTRTWKGLDFDVAMSDPEVPEAGGETASTLEIKDGNIKMETTTKSGSEEKIAVVKPDPGGFSTKIRNKLTAAGAGNVTVAVIKDTAEQAKILGLSANFWKWLGIIVAVGSVVWIAFEFYKYKTETNRELEITNKLIEANSTDTNQVELIDKANIEDYEKMKYKIIKR
jgi:hypothetical protein